MKRISVVEKKFKSKFESCLRLADKKDAYEQLREYMDVAFKMREMDFISDSMARKIVLMYMDYVAIVCDR